MKNYGFASVELKSGYLASKYELNRKITIDAVYDRFFETGRIDSFRFDWTPENQDRKKPHFFWDSDVAKWMESAAYILKKHPDKELEARVDSLVADIGKNQCEDGYFNIYFTVVEPQNRWANRDWHELYCAGHLFETAVALWEIGKPELMGYMDKYADYINKVFVVEKSAAFATPGHEEIELALIRMYRATGRKKYLDLAAHFINTRGTDEDVNRAVYNQSHLPVREQDTAVGHSVRAMYLYTSMAMLAKETGDKALFSACERLFEDTTERKMYVTGGIGSEQQGECFTVPFDLANDRAYTETCAGIGLMMFARAMSEIKNDAKYADVIERVLYNGVMSGLSLSGDSFFYENPLEINLRDRFECEWVKRRLPITTRPKIFACSCCPPNITRLLATLGSYIFAREENTLIVNQYTDARLSDGDALCEMKTDYPNDGKVIINASGFEKIAFRIPFWCDSFTVNAEYTIKDGYAYVSAEDEIVIDFQMPIVAVYSDERIHHNADKLCVMRGPIVYCAEAIDNGEYLHAIKLSGISNKAMTELCPECGLTKITLPAERIISSRSALYTREKPRTEEITLKLIPYSTFANRGETDMLVWFN